VERGAKRVLGLDRNRNVRGIGATDLVTLNNETARQYLRFSSCEFRHTDVGRQWHRFGMFDVVYLFSLYHHIYQNAGGDHNPVWYWLWRHLDSAGVLVWENPTTAADTVVLGNVQRPYHANYNEEAIMSAASRYFTSQYIGPAKHEDTREVFNFFPRALESNIYNASPVDGAGGATKAFLFAEERRSKEIEGILGFKPFPGSLNMVLDKSFDWDHKYFRSQVLDVKDRKQGINSEWTPRWARFYPVEMEGQDAWAFRFEGERHPDNFVELIAPIRLRDFIKGPTKLCQ
jgi:hypothetical protein